MRKVSALSFIALPLPNSLKDANYRLELAGISTFQIEIVTLSTRPSALLNRDILFKNIILPPVIAQPRTVNRMLTASTSIQQGSSNDELWKQQSSQPRSMPQLPRTDYFKER